MNGAPTARSDVECVRTRDGPTGREPEGHGAAVVVRGRESRPHGEGRQVGALQGEETRDAFISEPRELHPLESRLHRKGAWSVREGADGKGPAMAPRQPPTSPGRRLLAVVAGASAGGRGAPALGSLTPTRAPHGRPRPAGVWGTFGPTQFADSCASRAWKVARPTSWATLRSTRALRGRPPNSDQRHTPPSEPTPLRSCRITSQTDVQTPVT
jgi:hypothetical protein